MSSAPPDPIPALAGWPRPVLWAALLVASVLLAALLELAHVPAALMIGPMLAAVVAGALGVRLELWPAVSTASFTIIGVMIAAAIEPALFSSLIASWPVVIGATLATLAASAALGWLIAKLGILPGTTAIWGSAPGAASAMVLMADAFGADARLVAFMQYVRVIMVSVGAALIARWFIGEPPQAVATVWFPPIEAIPFATTLGVAAGGLALGRLLRLPSPHFLGPMLLGVAVHAGAGVSFQLPQWLMAAAFLILGWSIGLRFDRKTLIYSLKSLPHIMAGVVALMVFCGAIAWLLSTAMGVDPLTAYLATSPGGMDTVAVVAAAADGVDVAFVMTMQMMRFIIVLLFGPAAARWLAGKVE